MKSTISSATCIRFLIFIGAFFAFLANAGCKKTEPLAPIHTDCTNTFVSKGPFEAQVLEYSSKTNNITEKLDAKPEDRVIMTAIFHCGSGQLLYGTWRKMTASSKAELHFKGADGEAVLHMDDGLNNLIELPNGEVLAVTATVKQGDIDESLGDLSAYEGAREFPPPAPGQHYRFEDLPVLGQTYLEDIALDASTRKEIRRTRGAIGWRELRDGEMVFYAMDPTVYEFDPQTGRRKRLHDYRFEYKYGVPTPKLLAPTYYFSVNGELYAVAGSKAEPDTPGYLPENRLYRHDPQAHKWIEVLAYGFEPKRAAVDAGRIIAVGDSRISVYDTKTKAVSSTEIAFGPYQPTSLARVGTQWVFALVRLTPGINNGDGDSQLWVVSDTFDKVLLKYPTDTVGRIRLTSKATPTPARGW